MSSATPPASGPRVTRDQVRDLRRLRRPRQGRVLGGVCEGISRHLDVDPILVRVVFGALTIFGGAGIVLYVIAWLTIPEDGQYHSTVSGAVRQDPDRVMVLGLSLAAVLAGLTMLGAIGFATPRPWAVITVSLVALVLFTLFGRRGHQPPAGPYGPGPYQPSGPYAAPGGYPPPGTTATAAAGTPTAPDASTGTPSWSSPETSSPTGASGTQNRTDHATGSTAESATHAITEATSELGTEPTTELGTEPTVEVGTEPPIPTVTPEQRAAELRAWWQRDLPPGGPAGPGAPPVVPPPPRPPAAPRQRSRLTPIALALMALTLGSIWMADALGADIHPSVYPGSVLAISAAALLVGTWFGRAKLLIPIGLLAALLTAGFVLVGPGPYGERIYTPTDAAAVKGHYEHGAGRMVVNLEEVADPTALDGRRIDVEGRVGQVQVVIPTSLDAQVSAHVDGGEINGPSIVTDGGNGEQTAEMDARHDGRPLVTFDVTLKYGQIEILRVDCPKLSVATRGDNRSQDLSTLLWEGDDRDPAACH